MKMLENLQAVILHISYNRVEVKIIALTGDCDAHREST